MQPDAIEASQIKAYAGDVLRRVKFVRFCHNNCFKRCHLEAGLSASSFPFVAFLWIFFEGPFLLGENRVTVRKDPVSLTRRLMAKHAVGFVIVGNILLWVVDFVETFTRVAPAGHLPVFRNAATVSGSV